MYFKVRINSFIPGHKTTFDLFVAIHGQPTLYLRAGDNLSLEKIESLNKKDTHGQFLVKEEDRNTYRMFIRGQMQSNSLSAQLKAQVIKESAISFVEELFEKPDISDAIDASRPMVTDLVQFMGEEPGAMSQLIGLSGHDFYTFNHSVDVSIYSLGLGAALGMKEKELEELGVGSILHDVGKRNVPLEILCKKGGLDESEWVQMQKHPTYGLAILNEMPGITEGILASCYEHHESFQGNGYPQKLKGDEIHPFARIIALTDTFDAMTTQRSYNVPLKAQDALTMMKEKLSGRYDPEMLKAMHSVLFKMKAA